MPDERVAVYEHVVAHTKVNVGIRNGPFIDVLEGVNLFGLEAVLGRDGREVFLGGHDAFLVGTDDVVGVEGRAQIEILGSVVLESRLFIAVLAWTLVLAASAQEGCAEEKEKEFLHKGE